VRHWRAVQAHIAYVFLSLATVVYWGHVGKLEAEFRKPAYCKDRGEKVWYMISAKFRLRGISIELLIASCRSWSIE
jgi:hypothetical protein